MRGTIRLSVVAKIEDKEGIVFLLECCGNYISNIHNAFNKCQEKVENDVWDENGRAFVCVCVLVREREFVCESVCMSVFVCVLVCDIVYVCAFVCTCLRVSECVCVCERERERERKSLSF